MGGLGGSAAKEYKQMQNRSNPANSCGALHHGNSPDFDLNGNKFDTIRNLFPARHIAGFPQFFRQFSRSSGFCWALFILTPCNLSLTRGKTTQVLSETQHIV